MMMNPKELLDENNRLRAMRNHYRLRYSLACAAIVGILAVVTAATGAFWLGSRSTPADPVRVEQWASLPTVRTAGEAAEMPPHTLATLIMYNPGRESDPNIPCWCSATCISQGPQYGLCLGCGHCFWGNVGSNFWVYRPDGKQVVATLLGKLHSSQGDVSLFRIPTEDVLAAAPLWEGDTHPKSLDLIGYPGGQGPKRLQLGSATVLADCWAFPVKDGCIQPGNSGSGIFADGRLCGVISGYTEGNQREARTGCGFTHLANFLHHYRNRLHGCQDGRCRLPEPDAGSEPLPENKTLPPYNPPAFHAQPSGKLPPYNGHGKQPADLNTAKKKSVEIDKLRHDDATQQKLQGMDAKLDALLNLGQAQPLRPPAIDLSGVHSKLDAIRHDIADQPGPLAIPDLNKLKVDVVAGIKGELPNLLGAHLGPVEQRLSNQIAQHGVDLSKVPADVKAAILPELPAIGKQVAADVGPGLIAHLESILPGLIPAGVAGPGLLGMLGVIGGPIGMGATVGGWLLSRALKKHAAASAAASQSPGPGPPPPAGPAPASLVSMIEAAVEARISKQPQPQAQPAPVAADQPSPPPANQRPATRTVIVQPASIDTGLQAHDAMLQMLADANPALAKNGTIQKIHSFFQQAYSGLSPKKASA